MNRLFGSGGSTNVDGSSTAAAMSDEPLSLPRSSSGLGDGQAPDQVARQQLGAEAGQPLVDGLREARPDDHRRPDEVDEAAPRVLARRQRLREEVLDVVDLDAALAHPRHELVVLPLRALDPQDVVEQQLVVVLGREALEAQVGPVDDDPPQLADLGVDAERSHLSRLLPLPRALRPPRSCRPCRPRARRSGPASRSRRACRSAPRTRPRPRPWVPSSRRRSRACSRRRP